MKHLFRWIFAILAIAYVAVDLLFWAITKPITKLATKVGFLQNLLRFVDWVGALANRTLPGSTPYILLMLVLTPWIALEPLKIFGLAMIWNGRLLRGIIILTLGEVTKLVLVERIFHHVKPELMKVPGFEWCYQRALRVIQYLKSLPVYRALARLTAGLKRKVAALFRRVPSVRHPSY